MHIRFSVSGLFFNLSKLVKGIKLWLFILIPALVMMVLTGCQSGSTNADESTYLAVRKDYMDDGGAIGVGTYGRLVIENNAVRIFRTFNPGGSYTGPTSISMLTIWPGGYSLESNGEKTQVINEKGVPVAIVGNFIYSGGNFRDVDEEDQRERVNSLLIQPIPEDIPGPYWLVNPENSPMELLRDPFDRTNTVPDAPYTDYEGMLKIEEGSSKGYLILELGDGTKAVPLWPPGYTCQILNYNLTLLDWEGKPAAIVGEKVKISGSELSPERAAKYSGIHYKNPELVFLYIDKVIKNP